MRTPCVTGRRVGVRSVSITNTAGQATLTASTGIGSANAIETQVATLSATNTGASGNIDITESDGATVVALQQDRESAAEGKGRLVGKNGNSRQQEGAL